MRTQEQVNEIVRRLLAEYPEASCTLDYEKPYELLFATRLAAQCTDARVNIVTQTLFTKYPTLESFAEADLAYPYVQNQVHRSPVQSCGLCVEDVYLGGGNVV